VNEMLNRAHSISLRFLRYRPRTREEVRRRLRREKFPEEIIATVMTERENEGWFDDLAFSKRWIEERLHTRGLSLQAIRRELRQKGVDEETIQEAIESVSFDEKEVVFSLLNKKSRSLESHKLTQFLVRRGYSFEKAREYVKQWQEKQK